MLYQLTSYSFIFFFTLTIPIFSDISAQNLAINEIMASNTTAIADEDGDFGDWIEIYNYDSVTINLEGFGLSDNYDNPIKWLFPSVLIEPGEFLLIWASGKDRRDPKAPLHTNFSISSDGEEIILTDRKGIRIDEIPPTIIPKNISFGRYPDGEDDLWFFSEPTPGSENSSVPYRGVLEPVILSRSPGFYSDTIWLELSHNDPEVDIYYTLDGSIPDTNSILYSSSIIITDRSDEENRHSMIPTNFITGFRGWKEPDGKISKSTIIRARAFKPHYISPETNSATFFVYPEGRSRYSLNVISLICDPDALFSDSAGIYVPGDSYMEGIEGSGNYSQRGDNWERPVHLEIFNENIALKQEIGIRIHGGYTRRFPQKSLRIYARNEYGEGRINYQVFPDLPHNNFKRLILRNAGNDWNSTLFRDGLAQSLIKHLDLDTQAYLPTIVFINGEYWGIKNIRERLDKHYIERVYGVDSDNIDLLTLENTVLEGDNLHYTSMIDFITTNDPANGVAYAEVGKMMDIDNFLDYYSSQIYFGNNDWPHSNIDFWRLRVEYDSAAMKGHDGRWRWLLYDVDRSLGYFTQDSFNMIEWVTDSLNQRLNIEWPNVLLRNLLKNEEFKYTFINRIADHLNTAFIPERVHSYIDSMKSNLDPEIEEHIERWREPESKSVWNWNIQSMYTFTSNRPDYVRQYILDHFRIEKTIALKSNVNSEEYGYTKINSININPSTPGIANYPYPWTGEYFYGIPIKIKAIPNKGYSFSHWVGTENIFDSILVITPTDNLSIKAHFIESDIPKILNFWFFGTNLPNDTALDTLQPTYSVRNDAFIEYNSALDGYPFNEDHENWRKASLERRNAPTSINYYSEANGDIKFYESDMRGIQVRSPMLVDGVESAIIFHIPTLGYKDPQFRFAAKDEGAADNLLIDYSTAEGEPNWTENGIENSYAGLSDIYQLYQIDFAGIEEVNNNPNFKVRIRFAGENVASFDNSRVTFNNFSLHGTPLNHIFFSKPSGALNDLENWSSKPDGKGVSPSSFNMHTSMFYIYNRDEVVLDTDWSVTGIESKVIVGDDVNPINFRVNADLNANIYVESYATLELRHSQIPELMELKDGSSVIFTGEAVAIPHRSFYHLIFEDIDPVFHNSGETTIRGNFKLNGVVRMPDSRGEKEYDIIFTGKSDQLISSNGNIIRSYNMIFDKSGGSVSFSNGNGNSSISSDNEMIFSLSPEASFSDNGITIYAGNSVNISGTAESYNFTGNLILADFEEGIINGAGNNNEFSIRDSWTNNQNITASLNNLVIRAYNPDGQFRFMDGSSNVLNIKGDFIVHSNSAGQIKFHNNHINIGGDLIIEEGFTGSFDIIQRISLKGSEKQNISLGEKLSVNRLIIDNNNGVYFSGEMIAKNELQLINGIIKVEENSQFSLGPGAQTSTFGEEGYVDGPFGIYMNNTEIKEITFPIGKGDHFRSVIFKLNHASNNEILYTAELFLEAPPVLDLPGGLLQVFDDHYYTIDISGDNSIEESIVKMIFESEHLPIDQNMLRIAKSENDKWKNLGGFTEGGLISSTLNFVSPGIFAFSEQSPEVLISATAGEGGTIDPQGLMVVSQSTDKSFSVTANKGSHIKNIFIDNTPLPDAPSNFMYTYNFSSIIDDRSIHAEFATNNYIDIKVYPNPANEILWVEFVQNLEYAAIMSLLNMSGKVITEKTLIPDKNTSGFINLGDIAPGVYILKIIYGENIFHRKVLIL